MLGVGMATAELSRSVEKLADIPSLSRSELIEAITGGLPAELVRELAARMRITLEEASALLRLTPERYSEVGRGTVGTCRIRAIVELARLFFRPLKF